jgi:hypothetical protein
MSAKGAALKTGINAILCEYPETPVVVTADADGQHHAEDIMAIRVSSSRTIKTGRSHLASFQALH